MPDTARTYHPGSPTAGPALVTLTCGHTRVWDVVWPPVGMPTICSVPGHGTTKVRDVGPARR